MSSICIIPARAGSKRIIKKNIKPFMGKPIMGLLHRGCSKLRTF